MSARYVDLVFYYLIGNHQNSVLTVAGILVVYLHMSWRYKMKKDKITLARINSVLLCENFLFKIILIWYSLVITYNIWILCRRATGGGSTVKCPTHPNAFLVEDYRAGDMICPECGLVVGDRSVINIVGSCSFIIILQFFYYFVVLIV